MTDYRIISFLTLYETMNYHRTAEALHLSQPAVTQHIQSLEREYGCSFFVYDGRRLTRTAQAEQMAQYVRSALYNNEQLRQKLRLRKAEPLRIGATKTIGEYVAGDLVTAYLKDPAARLELIVDNTKRLLDLLDHNKLDFAMVEGFFDKARYGFRQMRQEPFVGICSSAHPFAGRTLPVCELFGETLLLRESGSGTRAILEQLLFGCGYTTDSFRRVVCISSFELICRVVNAGEGISFVYKAIADAQAAAGRSIAVFRLCEQDVVREFNYVYLPDTAASEKINAFLGSPSTP